MSLLERVLRFGEGKKFRALEEKVETVNAWEPETEKLSHEEIRAKAGEFMNRVAAGETLDDLLPEVFAVVREAARRTLGMRHFDVQVMGGVVLHEGKIAEMKTGEGKTLVATLPVCLNALTGDGVHVVTVNDYLAKRDAGWNGPIYHMLGLSVAAIGHDFSGIYDPDYHGDSHDPRVAALRPISRREAYLADITYGTNNEFGFDYLRDNMATDPSEQAQRGHHYAIVDEVDNILIDEARTPLIISGPARSWARLYRDVDRAISGLKGFTIAREDKDLEAELEEKYDYVANEKERSVKETARGHERIARALGVDVEVLFGGETGGEGHELLSLEELELVQHLRSAVKQSITAHALYRKDRDYVIRDGQVIIVDEFTGRLMEGRRYSEGLHEAIEAKEKVRIREENQTLATITLQNYFRLYDKLAGMTGTAATEADEFIHIYKLETVTVPTNEPMIRDDLADVIYKTEEAKFKAVIDDIVARYENGQPVLVGTISIEKSELLSRMLGRRGVKHEVLNAKHHEREAEIIAQAGRKAAVTIATNMAGRGVDIILGGNPPDSAEQQEVLEAGGLHVVGTERHEARRIDNQLRGRTGRQGDPGSSQFYLSLEDDLMRLFGSDRIGRIMERLGVPDDQPIEHSLITKSIETAQKQVEAQNFALRKHVLEYDDVMNKQREIIYAERARVLGGENLRDWVFDMIDDICERLLGAYANPNIYPEEWDIEGLLEEARDYFSLDWGVEDLDVTGLTVEELNERLVESARRAYEERETEIGPDVMRNIERLVVLQVIDNAWQEHLREMDYLREGIGLRAIGQRDPLIEYKTEAYDTFQTLVERIKDDVVRFVLHVQVAREEQEHAGVAVAAGGGGGPASLGAGSPAKASSGKASSGRKQSKTAPVSGGKVGRNSPCPCGSGKKYKKCCGS